MIDWKKIKTINNDLLDKILSIDDLLERAKEEQNLYSKGKELGLLKKQLEPAFNARKEEFISKKKIIFESGVILNSKGYYIKNNCIYTPKDKPVIEQLIYPCKILKNVATGYEQIQIRYKKNNGSKWEEKIVDREVLMTNSKTISKLGVYVTNTNAKDLSDYFNDILVANPQIPVVETTNQLGWYEKNGDKNLFIPYSENIVFEEKGDKDTSKEKVIWKNIKTCGDYQTWYNLILDARKKIPTRLLTGASIASVLLNKMDKKPFVIHVYGISDAGKSYGCEIAMSLWGYSAKGALMNTFNGTENGILTIASLCKDIPVFFDEFQTVDKKKFDINGFLMNYAEGMERIRGNIDGGLRESRSWNNICLASGEENVSMINLGGGTLNRLIEIYIDEPLIAIDEAPKKYEILHQNYGFGGEKVIEFIKEKGIDYFKNIFDEKYNILCKSGKSASKQSINMAMLWTGDEVFRECFNTGENPLTLEQVQKFMFTKEETDNAENAYNYVLEECLKHIRNFKIVSEDVKKAGEGWLGNGELWGLANDYEFRIIKSVLEKILKDNEFAFKITCQTWEKRGYIEKASKDRKDIHTSIEGQSVNLIILKRKKPVKEKEEIKNGNDYLNPKIKDKIESGNILDFKDYGMM